MTIHFKILWKKEQMGLSPTKWGYWVMNVYNFFDFESKSLSKASTRVFMLAVYFYIDAVGILHPNCVLCLYMYR